MPQLISGEVDSIRTIARQTGHDERYVARSMRLAFLSPDIIEAIVAENSAPQIALGQLLDEIPINWRDQKALYRLESAFAL